MKKFNLLFLFTFLLLGLIACTEQNKSNSLEQSDVSTVKEDARAVVWNQLKSEDKGRIDGTWKDAKVSKVTLREDMMSLIDDKSYAGKEVYLIDFPTTNHFEPNNMIVYADIETLDYIGHGLID